METNRAKILAGAGLTGLMLMVGVAAGSVTQSTSNAQATTTQSSAAQAQVQSVDQAAQAGSTAQNVAQTNATVDYAAAQQAIMQTIQGAQAAQTAVPAPPSQTQPTTKITQQQAEQTALATSPGNTVDHTRLATDSNGNAYWDVDFANGGGVTVDAQTGKVIATEAAGADNGGGRGHDGGADQAALAAQAKITKAQAEQAALTASPGNTVDHSRLGKDSNGNIFWDVDFTNGGGVTIDAQTGKVINTEAAGTDHPGGHFGGRGGSGTPPTQQP